MRNIWKRTAAAVLALAMCLSFAGCYDENMTWAARKGDDTLPIGGYIYFLYSAYSEAAGQVDTETPVLDAEIDGQDAAQWIKDRALNYVQAYYYINDKFEEYGLELTEDDQTQIDSLTNTYWTYYQSTFEDMGIAQSSFEQAYSIYSVKLQKVMRAMYGEGGELALADDELENYYIDTYTTYEYFNAPLTTTNDDGESVDLSEDEKADLQKDLEGYIDDINAGDMTVSEAADEYAAGADTTSTYQGPLSAQPDYLSTEIATALDSVEEGEAVFAETTSNYYVLRKLSDKDYYEENIASDEDQSLSLLSEMKGEEFNDYIMEQAASVEGVEINQAALDREPVRDLVNDSTRYGTSSETESSASESSAAE